MKTTILNKKFVEKQFFTRSPATILLVIERNAPCMYFAYVNVCLHMNVYKYISMYADIYARRMNGLVQLTRMI